MMFLKYRTLILLFLVVTGACSVEAKRIQAKNILQGDSSFETNYSSFLELGRTFQGKLEWEKNKSLKMGSRGLLFESDVFTTRTAQGNLVEKARVYSNPLDVVAGEIYTFSLYANAVGDKPVKIRLSSIGVVMTPGETWKGGKMGKEVELMPGQWKRLSLTFKSVYDKCRVTCELLSENSQVQLDDWQLEKGAKATDYQTPAPYLICGTINPDTQQVVFRGEKASFVVRLFKGWKAASNHVDLNVSFYDYTGKKIAESKKSLNFNGKNLLEPQLPLPVNKLGWYEVKSELRSDGEKVADNRQTFVIVPHPEPVADGTMPFRGFDNGSGVFPGMKRIGGLWAVKLFHWFEVEPKPREYDWTKLGKLKKQKEQGYWTKVTIGHLPAAPEWAWDQKIMKEDAKMIERIRKAPRWQKGFRSLFPERKFLKEWQDMVKTMVTKFGPYIDLYEVGGEDELMAGRNQYYMEKYPNSRTAGGHFVLEPFKDIYCDMLSTAAKEIETVYPNAKIGAIRPGGYECNDVDYSFCRPVLKQCGKNFNRFPLDSYCDPRYIDGVRHTMFPERKLPKGLEKAIEIQEKDCRGGPVFISEMGYAIDYRKLQNLACLNENMKRLVRVYLIARSTPKVESCMWYNADSSGREQGKYVYGIWNDGNPQPAVAAFAALGPIIDNVKHGERLERIEDLWIALFEKIDGSATAAIWVPEGQIKVVLPDTLEEMRMYDVMGNPQEVEIVDGGLSLEVTDIPVYFSLPNRGFMSQVLDLLCLSTPENAFEKLKEWLNGIQSQTIPVEFHFALKQQDEGQLLVMNKLNEPLKLELVCELAGKEWTKKLELPARGREGLPVIIPNGVSGKFLHVTAKAQDVDDSLVKEFPVSRLREIGRVSGTVTLDGNISEWRGMPSLTLESKANIQPPDPWVSWSGKEDLSITVWPAWDDKYLYVAAEVLDDKNFNKNAGHPWNADCFQLAIDPANNAGMPNTPKLGYNPDDFEFAVAKLDNGKNAMRQTAGRKIKWNIAIKRDDKAGKTYYELRFPLEELKIKPVAGNVIGMSFVLFDDDTGGGHEYFYLLSPGITGEKRPGLFPKFKLSTTTKKR